MPAAKCFYLARLETPACHSRSLACFIAPDKGLHLIKGDPELRMSAVCSATTKSLFLSSSASVEYTTCGITQAETISQMGAALCQHSSGQLTCGTCQPTSFEICACTTDTP